MVAPGALGARHPDVDRLRRLLRRRSDRVAEQAFVLEGPKLLAEAIAAGAPIEAVYVTPDAPPVGAWLKSRPICAATDSGKMVSSAPVSSKPWA